VWDEFDDLPNEVAYDLVYGGQADDVILTDEEIADLETDELEFSDSAVLTEIFSESPLLLSSGEGDDVIWAELIHTGEWALTPDPVTKQPAERPLRVELDSDRPRVVSLKKIVDHFRSGAVENVTVPLSHANHPLENTGFIKDLKIVETEPGKHSLMGAFDFRDPDVKSKIKTGTIAGRSIGVLFNHRDKRSGRVWDQVLDHVALTNRPWITGMKPFGVALSEDVVVESLTLGSSAPLGRTPEKDNWVDNVGGLPPYVREVARALHEKRGFPLSRAIATAISRIKKWAATSKDPKTKAKAAKAIAQWESMKARSHAKTAAKNAVNASDDVPDSFLLLAEDTPRTELLLSQVKRDALLLATVNRLGDKRGTYHDKSGRFTAKIHAVPKMITAEWLNKHLRGATDDQLTEIERKLGPDSKNRRAMVQRERAARSIPDVASVRRDPHTKKKPGDRPEIGDIIYAHIDGKVERVKVDEVDDNIKNGLPGWGGVVLSGPSKGKGKWGYDSAIQDYSFDRAEPTKQEPKAVDRSYDYSKLHDAELAAMFTHTSRDPKYADTAKQIRDEIARRNPSTTAEEWSRRQGDGKRVKPDSKPKPKRADLEKIIKEVAAKPAPLPKDQKRGSDAMDEWVRQIKEERAQKAFDAKHEKPRFMKSDTPFRSMDDTELDRLDQDLKEAKRRLPVGPHHAHDLIDSDRKKIAQVIDERARAATEQRYTTPSGKNLLRPDLSKMDDRDLADEYSSMSRSDPRWPAFDAEMTRRYGPAAPVQKPSAVEPTKQPSAPGMSDMTEHDLKLRMDQLKREYNATASSNGDAKNIDRELRRISKEQKRVQDEVDRRSKSNAKAPDAAGAPQTREVKVPSRHKLAAGWIESNIDKVSDEQLKQIDEWVPKGNSSRRRMIEAEKARRATDGMNVDSKRAQRMTPPPRMKATIDKTVTVRHTTPTASAEQIAAARDTGRLSRKSGNNAPDSFVTTPEEHSRIMSSPIGQLKGDELDMRIAVTRWRIGRVPESNDKQRAKFESELRQLQRRKETLGRRAEGKPEPKPGVDTARTGFDSIPPATRLPVSWIRDNLDGLTNEQLKEVDRRITVGGTRKNLVAEELRKRRLR